MEKCHENIQNQKKKIYSIFQVCWFAIFETILKNLKISKNDFSDISKFYNKISLKNQNKIKLYNNVRYTLNRLKKKKFQNWNCYIKK